MKDLEKIQQLVIDSACEYEYLYHFTQNVKIAYPNLTEEELKKKTLLVIKILLNKKILNVNTHKTQSQWDLSVKESIKKIDHLWFSGASYINFLSY